MDELSAPDGVKAHKRLSELSERLHDAKLYPQQTEVFVLGPVSPQRELQPRHGVRDFGRIQLVANGEQSGSSGLLCRLSERCVLDGFAIAGLNRLGLAVLPALLFDPKRRDCSVDTSELLETLRVGSPDESSARIGRRQDHEDEAHALSSREALVSSVSYDQITQLSQLKFARH